MDLKNKWTVVAGAAAAVAIGAAGVTMANGGGNNDDLPGPITLQDRTPVVRTVEAQPTPPFEVIPQPVLDGDDSAFDDTATVSTTFDSPDLAPTSPPPPPAAPIAPMPTIDDSFDSPDDSPARAPAAAPTNDSVDSPDMASASFDSPDNS